MVNRYGECEIGNTIWGPHGCCGSWRSTIAPSNALVHLTRFIGPWSIRFRILSRNCPRSSREAIRNRLRTHVKNSPKLWLFLVRNHGELTAADGLTAKAMQYEIGNPLTAERMTRHVLAAALYAPLRVVLYEVPSGRGVFEYDLPSSLFGQFDH